MNGKKLAIKIVDFNLSDVFEIEICSSYTTVCVFVCVCVHARARATVKKCLKYCKQDHTFIII